MELGYLKEKLEKLFFINNMIYMYGIETPQALYALQDEIKETEDVYTEVKEQFEKCF